MKTPFRVSFTVRNDNPDTIANRLAAKIGREPTTQELIAEVERILSEKTVDMATRGQLCHQRKG